jgi:hypothetical protein
VRLPSASLLLSRLSELSAILTKERPGSCFTRICSHEFRGKPLFGIQINPNR